MRSWLGPLALLVLVAPGLADDRKTPEGFTPLFDGKSLDGWRMVNTKDNFLVRDGLLVMNKGSGWLATEKSFADFPESAANGSTGGIAANPATFPGGSEYPETSRLPGGEYFLICEPNSGLK